MTRDDLLVVLIAVGCSGAVGLLGVVALRSSRRRSLRVSLVLLSVTTTLAVVAAVVGTAQAMLLSSHDFRVVLVATAVAGSVALAVSLLLGREIVRGSRALRQATRSLGDDGGFVSPVDPPTSELAALSAELEATSARLAESRRREQALDRSRRELVSWVSHDLRTPLAGLRAMAEALEDGVAEDPARYHHQILVEVDRLAALVDDLFELSRLQAGATRLTLDRVSLGEVVTEALAAVEPLAHERGVRLTAQASPDLEVRASSPELSRVVSNLVVNAIRHTSSDGTVLVSASRDGDAAVLEVGDQCGGIPEADLERVFQVAWRGTPARTPGPHSGAGLGLAIVQGIVEAHSGSVGVVNIPGGCRFRVRLPLHPA